MPFTIRVLCYLYQVRELALGSQEQEDCLCFLPTAALRRVGPVTYLGSTVELTLGVRVAVDLAPNDMSKRVIPASCLLGGSVD